MIIRMDVFYGTKLCLRASVQWTVRPISKADNEILNWPISVIPFQELFRFHVCKFVPAAGMRPMVTQCAMTLQDLSTRRELVPQRTHSSLYSERLESI
jgi:hypothetical protein